MLARAVVGASMAALVLTVASVARADAREDSRAAFLHGVSEAHLGHYTAARDDFLQAYKLFAHPSILLNLGIARWHTGEYVAAEQDLVRFLSDDGGASPEEIANARAALAAARAHLGTLRIRVATGGARATLDGAPVALVPGSFAEVRAVVGPNQLNVEAPGFAPLTKSVLIDRDRVLDVDLSLTPVEGAAPPPGGHETTPTATPDRNSRTLVGVGLLTGAGIAAGVGIFCGVRAIALANEYNTYGSGSYQDARTRSIGVTFRTTADVLFATAIVSGGVGVYLLAFPRRSLGGGQLVVGPAFSGVVGTF